MWWRLMHFIFGSDYVYLKSDWSYYVRRVQYTHNGRPYASVMGEYIWLDDPGRYSIVPLTDTRVKELV